MDDLNSWQVVRAVFWRPWARIVGTVWGAFGVLDVFDSRYVSHLPATSGFKGLWDQVFILPSLSWQTWLTGLAVIVAVVAVQGAYRFARHHAPAGAGVERRNAVITGLRKLSADERRALRELIILGRADRISLQRHIASAEPPFATVTAVHTLILQITAKTPFLVVLEKHNGHVVWGINPNFKDELDRWVAHPEQFA